MLLFFVVISRTRGLAGNTLGIGTSNTSGDFTYTNQHGGYGEGMSSARKSAFFGEFFWKLHNSCKPLIKIRAALLFLCKQTFSSLMTGSESECFVGSLCWTRREGRYQCNYSILELFLRLFAKHQLTLCLSSQEPERKYLQVAVQTSYSFGNPVKV